MLREEQISVLRPRIEPFDRFAEAIEKIDAANDEDPKRVQLGDRTIGYERHFSEGLFSQVLELDAGAGEALLLAARGQHICRWKMPRADYPMDRAGYLKWRSDLKRYHASRVGEILGEVGYEASFRERVESLNLKKNLSKDAECQTLEDALCLVFLEAQMADFRERTSEEKMISILQKTWGKMSERGRAAALQLDLDAESRRLVGLALGA